MSEYRQPPGGGGTANPGWYPDPWGRSAWRWWDGWRWSGWISPPENVGPAVVRQLVVQPKPMTAATPEAPYRERLPGGAPTGIAPFPEAPPAGTPPGAGFSPLPWAENGQPPQMPVGSYAPGYPGLKLPEQAIAEAARPVPRPQRRRLVIELVIVLAIFPLPFVVSALADLTGSLLGEGSGARIPNLFPGHSAAAFPFLLAEILLPLAAGALVLYLISQPDGDGGLPAIGLGKALLRADLALVLPVFLICFLVGELGTSFILVSAFHIRGISPSLGNFPSYYSILDVMNGVTSGIVEELVVLGYLIRRLEQLGLNSFWVVVLAVIARGSYHLYYGLGVLPILVWALASVLVYRRVRRLLPFILVHVSWDAGLIISQYFGAKWLLAESLVMIVPTIVFTSIWAGQIPRLRPKVAGP